MDIALKCRCGALRGVAKDLDPGATIRMVCMCGSCQAYARFLGRERDVLDANGGTDITPVVPAKLKLTAGLDQLKAVRMTEKGPLRWYAGCCNTPIANTPPNAGLPYAGVVHSIFDHAAAGHTREQDLGPVFMRIQGKSGKGPLPAGTHQSVPLKGMLAIARFVIPAKLRGQNRPTPFFTDDGQQVAEAPVMLRVKS